MKMHLGPKTSPVTATVDERNGRISWLSDWTRSDELVRGGYVYRVFYGPETYGHTDIHAHGFERD